MSEQIERLHREVERLRAERDDLAGSLEIANAELSRSREANRRLNRRCQACESAMTVPIEEMRRQGRSLGRALANFAAVMYEAERDVARADAEKLRSERDALRAELEAVEWDSVIGQCPSCGAYESKGHKSDCTLAAALHRVKE